MINTRVVLLTACFVVVSTAVSPASAQDGKGLDALPEDRVLDELAGRNLQALLDHGLKANNVPEAKQQGIKARVALTQLRRPDPTMTLARRRELVDQYVAGLNTVLPTMTDPKGLIADANTLIENGITEDLTLMEYWGENARTQARLRPVAEGVTRILDQAGTAADAAMNAIVNNWNDANAKRWAALDEQKGIAENTKQIVAYPLAVSIDKSDPKREEIVNAALEYLKPFDDPQNPDRAFAQYMLGKLNLAVGKPENLNAAREYFDTIIKDGDAKNTVAMYQARTFRAITDLQAGDLPAAQRQVDAVVQYASANGLNDVTYKALNETLKYRVLALEGEKAASDASRLDANNKAAVVLTGLLQQQPGLRGLIFEQLGTRVDPNAAMSSLDPLLLQAVVAKGDVEYRKEAGAAFDKASLGRAVDAAKELATRKGQAGVDDKLVEDATRVVPFFLEKLGDDKAAANAYLDYIDQYKASAPANAALNNAIVLVGKLRGDKGQMDDPQVVKAYERVLETAVNPPFNRSEFAFEYGGRLLGKNEYAKAVENFGKVKPDNKAYDLAQYFTMVASNGLLDTLPPDSPDRPKLVEQIQTLADKVNASAQSLLAAAKSDSDKARARNRIATTRLLAAKLAFGDQKDAERAIKLLDGFEQAVAGLADENVLLGQALLIRVQSLLQANKTAEVTTAVQQLFDRNPKSAGGIVFNLLEKMNADLATAEAAGNTARAAELQQYRASLTPMLVAYASRPDTKKEVRDNLYVYSVFDADTQRRAAESAVDPAKRTQLLENAMVRFKELESPENAKKYLESLTPELRAQLKYDRQVVMGIGQVAFALGNYDEARGRFGRLLNDNMVGTPLITARDDAGNVLQKDNDQYWEAMYKFVRAKVELKDNVEQMKGFLKGEYIKWGDRVGGQRWKKEFEALRQELIPDFDPKAFQIAPPPTAAK